MAKDKRERATGREVQAMALGVAWGEARGTFTEVGRRMRGKGRAGTAAAKLEGDQDSGPWKSSGEGTFHSGVLETLRLLAWQADIIERTLTPSLTKPGK